MLAITQTKHGVAINSVTVTPATRRNILGGNAAPAIHAPAVVVVRPKVHVPTINIHIR